MTNKPYEENEERHMAHALATAGLDQKLSRPSQHSRTKTVHRCRMFKTKKPWGSEFLSVVWDSAATPVANADLPIGELVFDEKSSNIEALTQKHLDFICESELPSGSHQLRNSL